MSEAILFLLVSVTYPVGNVSRGIQSRTDTHGGIKVKLEAGTYEYNRGLLVVDNR